MEEKDIAREMPSTSSSDLPGFCGLDTGTQQKAFKWLSGAALLYAIVYFLAFTTDVIMQSVSAGHFDAPSVRSLVFTVISIVASLLVVSKCRWGLCQPSAFSGVASAYLILAALGISAQAWGWEVIMGKGPLVIGVSWVGIWIVMFPSVVTLSGTRIAISSLIAALTIPAVTTLSVMVHGLPEGVAAGEVTIAITQLTVPVLICVVIAWALAHRVFCLARDASKARRLGSYRLTRRIGAGGMGEVWQAEHRMLARPAAIKLIRPEALGEGSDTASSEMALQRFEREAQATAQLTSPHSIVLYDFGIAEDGSFYYVMELLEGRDLKTLIQHSGPIPAQRAIHFLRGACHSLADAHFRGLIHRDIKPANLFACHRGLEFDFIKVLDFGLVKDAGKPGEAMAQLTSDGITSGTPGFMAPEMVTGERKVDERADIYALGCVAYWLLSGRLVFEGKSPMSILVQHAKEVPPAITSMTEMDVPRELEDLLGSCLAKDPSERPATALELDSQLAAIQSTLPRWSPEMAEKWWRTNFPDVSTPPTSIARETAATVVIAT